ncbi:amidase [Salinisphaera hydrothermalis]|uniref:Amidase n=1 Tax=Salinisphaera hydrothermalis (strain C41B8) TaxID=1304275 RepID=A0A084IH76_SALHC|nr:amidase [Salinisphaera hydrothermalis]KEZ76060.1 amidase [Salinisphaera hydrothermalis C41B8]
MTAPDPATVSIDTLLDELAAGRQHAATLVEHAIARIEALDSRGPALNAITHLAADEARAAAAASDRRRANGEAIGLLEGIPVLVKDNMDVAGWPTTAGSAALVGRVAQRDAPIVARLRRAGAIVLGKTAMHELAAGITGASSLTGFTRNAYALDHSPGGSSSGAAVAVAAGYVPLAIGSDTAGSVRIPAAFHHLYGLRASRGAIPLDGIVPLSPTQDMPGPLTRFGADMARAFAVLADRPYQPVEASARMRIGVLDAWFDRDDDHSADVASVCMAAVERLAYLGAQVLSIALENLRRDTDAANVIAYEFAEALAADLAAHADSLAGSPVRSLQDIVDRGLEHEQLTPVFSERARHPGTDSPGYQQALAARAALADRLNACFEAQSLDVMAYPTVRQPPTLLGGTQDGSNALLAPVTGFPAISLPAGFDRQGRPVGLELLARPGDESRVFALARAWDDAREGWTPPGGLVVTTD